MHSTVDLCLKKLAVNWQTCAEAGALVHATVQRGNLIKLCFVITMNSDVSINLILCYWLAAWDIHGTFAIDKRRQPSTYFLWFWWETSAVHLFICDWWETSVSHFFLCNMSDIQVFLCYWRATWALHCSSIQLMSAVCLPGVPLQQHSHVSLLLISDVSHPLITLLLMSDVSPPLVPLPLISDVCHPLIPPFTYSFAVDAIRQRSTYYCCYWWATSATSHPLIPLLSMRDISDPLIPLLLVRDVSHPLTPLLLMSDIHMFLCYWSATYSHSQDFSIFYWTISSKSCFLSLSFLYFF
jgi:hypothetical protein